MQITAEVTISARNQITLPREAREALRLKPGDKVLIVVRGEQLLLLKKPKFHHAAICGIGHGVYPKDYLRKERESWR